MRAQDEHDQLRDQARSLRLAGKSRREIKQSLDIADNELLTDLLQGVPPPAWTKRPNAKDDLRGQARELRQQGLKYREIAAQLNVSISSVSLWTRDIPASARVSPPKSEEGKKRSAEGFRRYQARERQIREAKRKADIAAAATEIGSLTDRELLIAGAIAYWCEGTKRKRPGGDERVVFMNSDPGLISFFLSFLDVIGVPRDDLVFRVHIHETADVAGAHRFWGDVTSARPDQFGNPTRKKHNLRTVRKNTGDDYHGCLRIDVRQSADLYRRIEGWASGAMLTSSPGLTTE